MKPLRSLVAGLVMAVVSACSPTIVKPGPAVTEASIGDQRIITPDGQALPLKSWLPKKKPPKAVILALHGFNDYSNFFSDPGMFLAQRYDIASYAYDQRGFGAGPHPGYWAGVDAYVNDARQVLDLLGSRHPGAPLFLLGESMGGAVAMLAMTSDRPPDVDGTILTAPAVWGRVTMPWHQRLALWIGANTAPWMTVTGEGLNIRPSDNIEMLIELGKDPLVIKKTRIGAIYGLANLMDAALESAGKFNAPALIMYGERDEVVPREPTLKMLDALPGSSSGRQRIAIYEGGYHMLLRDIPAATIWKDIAAWIGDPDKPLPSRADRRGVAVLQKGN